MRSAVVTAVLGAASVAVTLFGVGEATALVGFLGAIAVAGAVGAVAARSIESIATATVALGVMFAVTRVGAPLSIGPTLGQAGLLSGFFMVATAGADAHIADSQWRRRVRAHAVDVLAAAGAAVLVSGFAAARVERADVLFVVAAALAVLSIVVLGAWSRD